jgi:hypothetical protein
MTKKEANRQYYLKNKESLLKKHKQYRADNKEKVVAHKKQYYLDNKEDIIKRTIQYQKDNKEKFKGWKRKYKKKNWENILEKHKQYNKNRYHTDPLHRFKHNLRSRTYKSFKSKSWIKGGGTEKLLGCDWETAMKHIESQFESWMNWDNHGEWHIDHIIPLSSAKTKEEMIKLCHYTNLQPLLAEENISKGDKILNYKL